MTAKRLLSSGRTLKAFRVRQGVLQQDLAVRLNMKAARLGEIENGQRTFDRDFAVQYQYAVLAIKNGEE